MNQYMDSLIIDRELLLNITEWYSALDHMDLLEIIQENLGKLDVRGYEFKGYVKAIDSAAGYMEATMELLDPEVQRELFHGPRGISTKVQDAPPVKYAPTAKVRNSMIATGCIVKGTVENSVVFRGCTVEEGAVIRNSIVMPNCTIEKDVLVENVICDKFVRIGGGAHLSGSSEKPMVVNRKQYS